MQCSMTLVNAGGLVWCGEDGHGLNLNCQRAERDHAAASRRRIGPEWCPLFTLQSLTSAMYDRVGQKRRLVEAMSMPSRWSARPR